MPLILRSELINNKKAKKLRISDLPDYTTSRNEYYAKTPEEIPALECKLIEEFNSNPQMPIGVLLDCLRNIAELYGIAKLTRTQIKSGTSVSFIKSFWQSDYQHIGQSGTTIGLPYYLNTYPTTPHLV